jgi:N-acetylglucosamine-6-phosphate deacetylase
MASLTPAKVIGADNAKGSLAADKDDILNIAKRPEYS